MYGDMDGDMGLLDREVAINPKSASSVLPLPLACSRFAADGLRTPSQLEAQQPHQQPQEPSPDGCSSSTPTVEPDLQGRQPCLPGAGLPPPLQALGDGKVR